MSANHEVAVGMSGEATGDVMPEGVLLTLIKARKEDADGQAGPEAGELAALDTRQGAIARSLLDIRLAGRTLNIP